MRRRKLSPQAYTDRLDQLDVTYVDQQTTMSWTYYGWVIFGNSVTVASGGWFYDWFAPPPLPPCLLQKCGRDFCEPEIKMAAKMY